MTLMTSKVLLLLVWVAVLSPTNVSSFSATTTTTPTATGSSSSSSSSSSLPKIPDNPISAELLQLLKLKFDQVKSDDDDDDKEIDALVYNLINTKSNTFDPTTSINGDFFAAVHTIGPTPLWEKISRGGTNPTKNLKGQKYTIGDNDEKIVVNYSEILGNGTLVHLTYRFSFDGWFRNHKKEVYSVLNSIFGLARFFYFQPVLNSNQFESIWNIYRSWSCWNFCRFCCCDAEWRELFR